MDLKKNNDEIIADNFSNLSLSSLPLDSTGTVDKNVINFLHNNSLMSYGEFKILPKMSNIKVLDKKCIFIKT